ncbi:MAG TPA: class I SAM-dependent methyltransferase [Anaerolineaceae bacterium]|nr:class I SAM-dependent methyltransferase [Anaerolineaceae bacterium]
MNDPKQRFSSRVEDYIRCRPGYPREVLETLERECGLRPGARVADIGSGTGILTRLFLDAGYAVVGVEPNREMREAGERLLAGYPGFTSREGSAEETGLPDASVDLITAAQAFHWFDIAAARLEFTRILRRGGWVALMWNELLTDATPFLRAYEDLLHVAGTDYRRVNHTNVGEEQIAAFFAPAECRKRSFPNRQIFDYAGLEGRLRSSSYTPQPGDPGFAGMIARLKEIFAAHQENGQVAFEYVTGLYFGQLLRSVPFSLLALCALW